MVTSPAFQADIQARAAQFEYFLSSGDPRVTKRDHFQSLWGLSIEEFKDMIAHTVVMSGDYVNTVESAFWPVMVDGFEPFLEEGNREQAMFRKSIYDVVVDDSQLCVY